MSADTESFKSADTDSETDISAEISADTDTETDNFLSLKVTTLSIACIFYFLDLERIEVELFNTLLVIQINILLL
jgi:hypothetical protein